MTEAHDTSVPEQQPPPAPDSPRLLRGPGLRWLALLLLVMLGVVIGPGDATAGLQLANPIPDRSRAVQQAFAQLPDAALVLVAMDADLGTYPEIRPTLRAAFDDLLRRGAALAFVSVTVEGRSVAAAELARLREAGVPAESLIDLGFVSGAEAGMVRLVGDVLPRDASGPVADAIAAGGGGVAAFDLALLVGGIDIGPRSWVEQVGTRLPGLPMVAVAPTLAQPELGPYLRTGQLVGLLATVRDGATYVGTVAADGPAAGGGAEVQHPASSLAMLLGMLAALAVIGRQLIGALPGIGSRGAELADDEEQP